MFYSNSLNVLEIDLFFSSVPKSFFGFYAIFSHFKEDFKKNELTDLTTLSGGEKLDEKHANRISYSEYSRSKMPR